MSVKEYAKSCLYNFFIITTLVNIAMFILGSIYRNGATLNYDAFLYPPLYGILGTLPEWIVFSKKELTVKQMLVRKIIQIIVLEILLTSITFVGTGVGRENIPMIASFAASVLIIYVLVAAISWMRDGKKAKSMMADLKNYQSLY